MSFMDRIFGNTSPKLTVPNTKWINDACAKNTFTPDLPELETKARQRVFVYGEEMPGHPKHFILKDGNPKKMCVAFTTQKHELWLKKQGRESTCFALNSNSTYPDRIRIKGFVYEVDSSHLLALDKYRKNGVEFIRHRVLLVVPYRPYYERPDGVHVSTMDYHAPCRAWMYIGNTEFWRDLLDGGYFFSPVERFALHQSRLGDFSFLTSKEYGK